MNDDCIVYSKSGAICDEIGRIIFPLNENGHSDNGKFSVVKTGDFLVCEKEGKGIELVVTKIDTSVDYNHVVTAVTLLHDVKVEINPNTPIFVTPKQTGDFIMYANRLLA